jgi:carbon dioxide concentrating mechanism protein CcmN
MALPILQPSSIDTTQIRGDVTIDQSVIIASGVILNATQGNKIIIRAGVCLGMGTIITAYHGDVEIKENAILGSGSLILGNCIVGSQVSLGASVTVYQTNIDAMSVVPAGSIIGDRSRQVNNFKEEVINSAPAPVNSHTQTIIEGIKNGFSQNIKIDNLPIISENNNSPSEMQNQEIADSAPENNQESPSSQIKENQESETEILNSDVWEETPPQVNTVVGQVYINKLLFTLFPEKQNKNKN